MCMHLVNTGNLPDEKIFEYQFNTRLCKIIEIRVYLFKVLTQLSFNELKLNKIGKVSYK